MKIYPHDAIRLAETLAIKLERAPKFDGFNLAITLPITDWMKIQASLKAAGQEPMSKAATTSPAISPTRVRRTKP